MHGYRLHHTFLLLTLLSGVMALPLVAQVSVTCPAPATGAFTGCYYPNTTLSGNPVFARKDNAINFYWGNNSPHASLPPLNFSVRWQGNFPFSQGTYTFTAIASDGIRIYVDGNLILDRWRDQAPYIFKAGRTLSQGNHLITVEYYESTGGATAQISWQNTTPGAKPLPVISSFTATPSSTSPGQPVTLAWNVTGATSINIDNAVGNVTNRSSITVFPSQTTTYKLSASNEGGVSTATVTAVVASSTQDTQPPTPPALVSAAARSASAVDLVWSASTDNMGVTGYQIQRNGSVIASVPGTARTHTDTSVSANSTYTYIVKAYDARGNYSAASNSIQVSTPNTSTPTNTCPAPASGAFTGCYYNNTTLSGNPVLTRTDGTINFSWGNGAPHASLAPLNFSVRWQGYFTFSQGTYTFNAITSDGMRVYVDGAPVIDAWRDQSPYMYRASRTLNEGSHLIVVEYYERSGGATAQLSWQNSSPAPGPLPVISSFTATPASTAPGQAVTLSWNVTGATSISIDNGVGSVSNSTNASVFPTQTTAYRLSASNQAGTSTATVTVNVGSSTADTQPPTAPTLVSATARSTGAIDLVWAAGSDNTGIAGYQIFRNTSVIASVPGNTLTYTDTTGNAGYTYTYALIAYDAAGNRSMRSNEMLATVPVPLPNVSVIWHGACWQPATIYGVTGRFQAMDFVLNTPSPVPVQATLFFGPNCNPKDGTDNMNDFNELTGTTHMVRGFTFHPDEIPTSALYWVGNRTVDGLCPPGAPCSGCVNYTLSTPECSNIH